MPKIFISYRRNDSASNAGRIYDRLEGHFGQGQVFMDVDTIRPGLDFVEVVQEAVGSCDARSAVIGREWLEASDESGWAGSANTLSASRSEVGTSSASINCSMSVRKRMSLSSTELRRARASKFFDAALSGYQGVSPTLAWPNCPHCHGWRRGKFFAFR